MSHPSLPTSEGDLIVPLPDQALMDAKLKHLRGPAQRKPHQRIPAGLVVDPINLLQCISGSDSTYTVNSVSTYVHAKEQVTVVSSPSGSQQSIFSFPKSDNSKYHSTESGSQFQPAAGAETKENEGGSAVEHFEVDPHARGVLAFRRNSLRQFSPLMEENEDKETSSYPPPTGGPQSSFTTPLFVISDGIRKTYFPGDPNVRKKQEARQSDISVGGTESPVAVYEQVSNPHLLRKIQSHPELSSLDRDGPFGDRPVATFPKVKATINSEATPGSMSIFSSIAGELRSHVRATGKQEVSERTNAVAVIAKKTEAKGTAPKMEPTKMPETSPGKTDMSNIPIPDIPDEKPKKKSFVKTLFKWGTESKVKVSDKESNMYSPASF